MGSMPLSRRNLSGFRIRNNRSHCYPEYLMRKILLALGVVLMAGCGYEGSPLPPLANVPGRVSDLSATQRGARLLVEFTPPQLTTEGFPIKPPLDLDVRVGPGAEPVDEGVWTAGATKLPRGEVAQGSATYETPVTEWIGKQVVVGVRATGSNRKSSGWTFASIFVVPAPQTPSAVRADNTEQGIRLTWSGPESGFRIFRKTVNEPLKPIADVGRPPWTDTTTQFGQEYTYSVQAIVELPEASGPGHQAASDLSGEISFTPKDEFPPATPSGLRAAAAPKSIELSWNGNDEADLAGYRVYRGVAGGPMRRVVQVEVPAYSDTDLQPEKIYRYTVAAVDRAGNESTQTTPVELPWQ